MPTKSPGNSARARRRAAVPGKDQKTLGQRLRLAMESASPPMTERDLLRACKQITGDDAQVSQQLVNQILNEKNSRSAVTPILAEACGVRAVWMQFGIGEIKDHGPNGRGKMSHRDRADKAMMEAFRELPTEWEFTLRSIVTTLAVAMRESHQKLSLQVREETERKMLERSSSK